MIIDESQKKINFPLMLAPMVGLSHLATRRLLRQYLPEGAKTLWPTEMLSSHRLVYEKVGETPETLRDENEDYLVPQILGNKEEPLKKSLEKLMQWGANGIDINMGCPVQKALRHNYGVSLMGDPSYAADIVKMVVQRTSLPVSVKLRIYDRKIEQEEFLFFIQGLVKAGASWLTLHPRTAEQKRRGQADWSQIRWLKVQLQKETALRPTSFFSHFCEGIPLIGNGDVQNLEDVHRMFSETQCDGVMVGRALMARPWLFWQWAESIKERDRKRQAGSISSSVSSETFFYSDSLVSNSWGDPPRAKQRAGGPPLSPEEEAHEYAWAMMFLLDEMLKLFPQDLAIRKFSFFIKTGAVWLDYGHQLLGLVCKHQKDPNQLKEAWWRFFKQDHRMMSSTNCRE